MCVIVLTFLTIAGAALATPASLRVAAAQIYPARPITIIVPAAAGGTTDLIARIMAERMKGPLGQPVIVENMGGADGSIGAGRVARARPDGYTIEIGHMSNHVLNGAFYSLNYDVLNDFTPIAPLGTMAFFLAGRKNLPVKDLRELVEWLRSRPNSASLGVATAGVRLLAMQFQKETGTRINLVPYRGVASARQDLVAGQIDLMLDPLDAISLVRSGSTKALAVIDEVRLAAAPNIPTFTEMGLPSIPYSTWFGFFAPKGTPKEIIDRLNAAAVEATADPEVRSRLIDDLMLNVFPREQQTPEALGALVEAGAEKWWPIIKEFGIKAE
jgi:tripartite-type tricarboxylate transporter receptor subunit TctC